MGKITCRLTFHMLDSFGLDSSMLLMEDFLILIREKVVIC